MANQLIKQNDFTHGEVDETFINRTDLELYDKALKQANNVVVRPEGPIQRRPGTRLTLSIDTGEGNIIFRGSTILELLPSTSTSDGLRYLLVVLENVAVIGILNIYHIKDNGNTFDLVQTINPPLYTNNITFINSSDESIIIDPKGVFALHVITPAGTIEQLLVDPLLIGWTNSNFVFKNLPAFDFGEIDYDSTTFTLNTTEVGEPRTLTSTAAIFTPDFVGGQFFSFGDLNNVSSQIGVAQITAFTDANNVTVTIISEFDPSLGVGGVTGRNCFLGEPVFSITRGFPISGAFYENRLWLADKRQSIFGSKLQDFRNYETYNGFATDGMAFTLGGEQNNRINFLFSGRGLLLFTINGEYSVPQYDQEGITPDNFSFRLQSNFGSELVTPAQLDNQTFFVAKGGKKIVSLTLDPESGTFISTDVSLFYSDLIIDPFGLGVRQASQDDSLSYLFVLNRIKDSSENDLAILQINTDQNVAAWTKAGLKAQEQQPANEGTAIPEDIIFSEDDLYLVTRRTAAAPIPLLLEKVDFSLKTDLTTVYSGVPVSSMVLSVDSPSYINVVVTVRGNPNSQDSSDGDLFIYGPFTGDAMGVVDFIDSEGNPIELQYFELGINYIPTIETLTAHVNAGDGDNLYHKKRISTIYLDLLNSSGVYLDGFLVSQKSFSQILEPLQPETRIYDIPFLSGWNRRKTVTITQREPLPMTVLGIGYEITPG